MQLTKKQIFENKIRKMVREEMRGATTPGVATFNIVQGFKSLKQMMQVLENATSRDVDVDSFWETYDEVMPKIEQKLQQIKNSVEKSR